MDGGSIEKWHTIFAAGIDIYTMCVEQGMSGTVFHLGWSPPPPKLSQKILAIAIFSVFYTFPNRIKFPRAKLTLF